MFAIVRSRRDPKKKKCQAWAWAWYPSISQLHAHVHYSLCRASPGKRRFQGREQCCPPRPPYARRARAAVVVPPAGQWDVVLVHENERFELVFAETGPLNLGTGLVIKTFGNFVLRFFLFFFSFLWYGTKRYGTAIIEWFSSYFYLVNPYFNGKHTFK